MKTLLQNKPVCWGFVLVLITTVGALVRFLGLEAQSFWIDEYLWTVNASKGLPAVIYNPDGYPPLYGMLVYFLLWAGLDADWWLRLPSATAGTLAIPVVYIVGRQVEDRSTAATAAALLALNPLAVWYAQETGAYSLLILCTLVSTFCFLMLLSTGDLWSAIGYALCAGIGFGLHYYFLFVVATHALVASLDFARHTSRRRVWLWTGLLTLMALAVWGPFFPADLLRQSAIDSSQSFSWLVLPYTALTFAGGFSFGPPLRELHPAVKLGTSAWENIQPHFASALLAVGVSVSLMALSFARRLDIRRVLVLLLIIMPVFGAWLSSALFVGYRPRYVLPALPFALLWFSSALQTRFQRLALLLLLLLATIGLVGLAQIHSTPYAREDNYRAAQYIANKDGNAPVVLLGTGVVPFPRYAKNKNYVSLQTRDVQDASTLTSTLSRILRETQREFWLVTSRPWTVDPEGRVLSFLNNRFELREEQAFAGVTVRFYVDGKGKD